MHTDTHTNACASRTREPAFAYPQLHKPKRPLLVAAQGRCRDPAPSSAPDARVHCTPVTHSAAERAIAQGPVPTDSDVLLALLDDVVVGACARHACVILKRRFIKTTTAVLRIGGARVILKTRVAGAGTRPSRGKEVRHLGFLPPLRLGCISAVHLGCVSAASQMHLGCISASFLGCISASSRTHPRRGSPGTP